MSVLPNHIAHGGTVKSNLEKSESSTLSAIFLLKKGSSIVPNGKNHKMYYRSARVQV